MKIGSKTNFEKTLEWISYVIGEISKNHIVNEFFDKFAKPVSFEKFLELECIPLAISLDTSEVEERLALGDRIKFREVTLSSFKSKKLLDVLKSEFLINKSEEVYVVHSSRDGVGFDREVGELKYNQKSISIRSQFLKYLSFESDNASVLSFFNNDQSFIISFDKLEYVYTLRKVFQDNGIKSYLKELLNAFCPCDFGTMTSEKGRFTPAQTSFQNSCVFSAYEEKIKLNDSILICDDLGDEWADYVELNIDKGIVRFSHLKYSENTTGASKFHDVVGQGLKNIGRLSLDESEFNSKLEGKWNNNYPNSSIPRIRTGHNIEEIKNAMKEIVLKNNLTREICLVTSFVSKSNLVNEFLKIEGGEVVKPHITQLIWLLMTFVYTCKEQGVVPVIYCNE
jgi:hypothetical protein